MTIKELIRPLPGMRRISLLRQQMAYSDSTHFWEGNYAQGRTSGNGSYGALAEGKSRYLNALVREQAVRSVIEFGCGDGNQLSIAEYPSYIGLDVSRTAIGLCQRRFNGDLAKSFFLYDGACFTDQAGIFTADLALSLDVLYHLTEDAVSRFTLRTFSPRPAGSSSSTPRTWSWAGPRHTCGIGTSPPGSRPIARTGRWPM